MNEFMKLLVFRMKQLNGLQKDMKLFVVNVAEKISTETPVKALLNAAGDFNIGIADKLLSCFHVHKIRQYLLSITC